MANSALAYNYKIIYSQCQVYLIYYQYIANVNTHKPLSWLTLNPSTFRAKHYFESLRVKSVLTNKNSQLSVGGDCVKIQASTHQMTNFSNPLIWLTQHLHIQSVPNDGCLTEYRFQSLPIMREETECEWYQLQYFLCVYTCTCR